MRNTKKSLKRRGTILPLVALSIVPLVGFVALAVDLGMIALARTEAQNAADTAAMSGLRTLNGDVSANYQLTQALANANSAAGAQTIIGTAVNPTTQLTLQTGSYMYDATNNYFFQAIPRVSTENYTLMKATVTFQGYNAFATVWGLNQFNVGATSVAVHRPRDLALVLDFSGSMNNESDVWNNESYLGASNNSPNSLDTRIPQFGWYNGPHNPTTLPGSTPTLLLAASNSLVGRCNVTQPALGIPAMVDDYLTFSGGAVGGTAFTAAPNSYGTTPAGDMPLYGPGNATSGTFARTVANVVTGLSGTTGSGSAMRNSDFESGSPTIGGYDFFYQSFSPKKYFKGYTEGPAYWGKTFFVWPPDPRTPAGLPTTSTCPSANTTANSGGYVAGDWRKRFFIKGEKSTFPTTNFSTDGVDDNQRIFSINTGTPGSSAGTINNPSNTSTGYRINYKAVLQWIKYCGDNPFPTGLYAGRVVYYDAIPDDVPAGAYDSTVLNRNVAWNNQNERFWKEYIDYVFGVWRSPMNTVNNPQTPACSIGPEFVWVPGSSTTSGTTTTLHVKPTTGSPPPYMDYTDYPRFPRHRYWFGPQTMIQYLSDTGLLPGTSHDISMITLKLGLQGAFQDIQTNYPNTKASLAMFSRPRYNGEGSEVGRYYLPQVQLTGDYNALIDGLWYPPGSTSSSQIRPWDSLGTLVPAANADYTANTASYFGFMTAHNQFSNNSSCASKGLGGNGRRGSYRLMIFETDGMANQGGTLGTYYSNLYKSGSAGDSWYDVSTSVSNNLTVAPNMVPGGTASTDTYTVVNKLVLQETAGGMARSNQPVTIHCLAFGAVFDSGASGTEGANAATFLQTISTAGGTAFPAYPPDSSDPNYYKYIIGTQDQRKANLRTSILKCMKSGVRIALIQ